MLPVVPSWLVAAIPEVGFLAVVAGVAALGGAAVGAVAARFRSPPPAAPSPVWRRLAIPIARCDGSWTIREVNPAFTQLLGYPEDLAPGLTLLQLALDEERVRVRRRLGAVTGAPRALAVRCRKVDGGAVTTRWLIDVDGDDVWVVLAPEVRDGAETPNAREVWHRASARLREPLMAIVGTAEQLSLSDIPAPARDSVATIATSALSMSALLDQYSRADGQEAPAATPRPRPRTSSRARAQHILVVEDHVVNAQVIQQTLRRLGYSSTLVENGELAVRAFQAGAFDAVLMDCQMPVMDGYEATRRIRELERETGDRIPIIAVTAHALVGDRERCIDAGMDDYLTKPVRLEQLGDVLESWLGPAPPTEEAPAIKTVDDGALAQLRELLGDDFSSTVELFLADTAETLAASREAWEARDWDELVRRTHSLKSTAAYMGARQVSDLCNRIVQLGRTRTEEGIPNLLARLDQAFELARRELEPVVRS